MEQFQRLLNGAVTIGAFHTRLRRGAFLCGNFLGTLLVDVGLTAFDQFYGKIPNALNGRYHLVEITERFGGVQMPEIILSDMRVERRRKTMKADFGSTLIRRPSPRRV